MFQDLRVRIVGVVENMSYYECSHCHSHDLIFGRGYTNMLMDQFGIQVTYILSRTPFSFHYFQISVFIQMKGHQLPLFYPHNTSYPYFTIS